MDDVLLGKVQNIRDCVRRIRAVDPGDLETLERDLLRQESLLLNVQRACQATIDLATHLTQRQGLGPPSDSRDAFTKGNALGATFEVEPLLLADGRLMMLSRVDNTTVITTIVIGE